MAKTRSFGDILHYTNTRTYSRREGEIDYLDGAPLRRPFSMPAGQRLIAGAVVLIAVAVGLYFLNTTILAALREAQLAEQSIQENLARQASIETLPKLEKLITLDDDSIKAKFEKAGYTTYETSTEDEDELILYKLPDDMTIEEAAALYAKGISNITAVQATKLLNGSWQFVSEHSGVTSMVVRYADFTTGDPLVAIQNALEKTGFDPESVTETGEDDSGNTYSMGTIELDDATCTWKISSLPLSDMYSINNIPENACYVGIRLTK